MNNFIGFWGMGTLPDCLVLGLEGDWGRGIMGQSVRTHVGGGEGVGSGLVGLHMKGVLTGESFAIS